MSAVRAIEEEYWTVQYWTSVLGEGMRFWPEDGTGRYGCEADAQCAAQALVDGGSHSRVRVLHVVRRVEYGPPVAAWWARQGEASPVAL